MFLQYLVEQTANVVKSERKPRRNIQYKDVGELSIPTLVPRKCHPTANTIPAGAVARIDNLEFLTDVVPKTITYKEHKAKKAKESATLNGQTTLVKAPNGTTFAAAQALPATDTSAAQTPAEDEMDVEPNQANPETPTSAS